MSETLTDACSGDAKTARPISDMRLDAKTETTCKDVKLVGTNSGAKTEGRQTEKASTDSKDVTDAKAIRPISAIAHRIFHPPTLERKHSSGDLHSRLKTRKILGVGETDNGDIHRSKISQLLGHNEHLYVKFPRGYWVWHLGMAIYFTLLGLNNLLFPENSFDLPARSADSSTSHNDLACRFYGCTSLALAFLLWSLWEAMDKGVVRLLLLAVAFCHTLQIVALTASQWGQLPNWKDVSCIVIRAAFIMPNAYFYRKIGLCGLRMRKSASYSNLKGFTNNSNSQMKRLD